MVSESNSEEKQQHITHTHTSDQLKGHLLANVRGQSNHYFKIRFFFFI